jgi:tetratricopeptide (TPR) repeat protein
MLTALPNVLSEGWILSVPEGDYFAADGTRLEGAGVAPDVESASEDAFVAAARRVRLASAYARAVLLGWAHNVSRQYTEGEARYREARRLAPDSLAPLYGLATVYRQRGESDRVFELWEERLRQRPNDLYALLQLGGTAAATGLNLNRGIEVLDTFLRLGESAPVAARIVAQKQLARIHEQRRDIERARASWEAVRMLDPDDAEAQSALRRLRAG